MAGVDPVKLGRKVARGGGAVKPKAKAGRGAGVGSGVGERREADGAGERSVDGTTSELSEKVSGSSPSSRAADRKVKKALAGGTIRRLKQGAMPWKGSSRESLRKGLQQSYMV